MAGLWLLSRAPCWQWGAPIICHVDTDRPIVALSFDDGPTAQGLDAILPVLASRHVHATFFLIGRDVEKHPGLTRRLIAAGHEIGNHSYSHQRMWFHLPVWYDEEIARTDTALRREGANGVRLFRPPYGKKLLGLPSAVARAGLITVTWDVKEPATDDPATYARTMLAQVRPGSILLVHAMYRGRETERRALPLLLDGLARKGYQIVPVGALLAGGRPTDKPPPP